MKNMLIRTKKIGKSGGMTIPSDVRRHIGIEPGSAVDMEIKDGKIILCRHTPRCMFCNSRDELIKFDNRDICPKCIEKMRGKANEQ